MPRITLLLAAALAVGAGCGTKSETVEPGPGEAAAAAGWRERCVPLLERARAESEVTMPMFARASVGLQPSQRVLMKDGRPRGEDEQVLVSLELLGSDEDPAPLVTLTVGPYTGLVHGEPLPSATLDEGWLDVAAATKGPRAGEGGAWLYAHRGDREAVISFLHVPEAETLALTARLKATAEACMALR